MKNRHFYFYESLDKAESKNAFSTLITRL